MNRQELAREYCYEKIGGTSGQDSFDYTYDGFIAGFDKALELIEEWTCNMNSDKCNNCGNEACVISRVCKDQNYKWFEPKADVKTTDKSCDNCDKFNNCGDTGFPACDDWAPIKADKVEGDKTNEHL